MPEGSVVGCLRIRFKQRTQNPSKSLKKTAFEAKRRRYTTGEVIERLFNIDLYILSDIQLQVKQTVNQVHLLVQNKTNKIDLQYKIYLIDCYIENITRWREDMNFMFEWQEQYLTSERSERVRYCSCHENIKFISSS